MVVAAVVVAAAEATLGGACCRDGAGRVTAAVAVQVSADDLDGNAAVVNMAAVELSTLPHPMTHSELK